MANDAVKIGLELSDNQFTNALGIILAVKKRGWTPKAAVIAVETALTESGMRILASANVPASQRYPHDLLSWTSDGLGHDHASMGMYQQQTGYAWTPANESQVIASGVADMTQSTMDTPNGWGTPAELMNPERSTGKFLDALAHQDWRTRPAWQVAQAVQGSAFADGSNYQAQDARARNIVTQLWPLVVYPPIPTHVQEDEMPHLYVPKKGGAYPVLVDGAVHTVIAHAATTAALLGKGALLFQVESDDYARIRHGAIAR